MRHPTAYIHPMACVDDSIKDIGPGTKIWQFASVIRGSIIGERSVIGNCAIVDASRIADNVRIQPGAVIFPGAMIWQDVFVGPNVVLCNDFWPSVDKDGWNYEALLNGDLTSIRIYPGASIFAGAKIMPGITIGEGARVAANAIVKQDVPDNCLYGRDGSIEAIRGQPRRQRTC